MTADDPAFDAERVADRFEVSDVSIDTERSAVPLRSAATPLVPPDDRPFLVEQACKRSEIVPHAGPAVAQHEREAWAATGALDPQLDTAVDRDDPHTPIMTWAC